MAANTDLTVRQVMDSVALDMGNVSTEGLNALDIEPYLTGGGTVLASIQSAYSGVKQGQEVTINLSLTKDPPNIINPKRLKGLTHKTYTYVLIVTTPSKRGVYFNEAVCSFVESVFPYDLNAGLTAAGDVIRVTKSYQQANPTNSGSKLLNRVFVECEVYTTKT